MRLLYVQLKGFDIIDRIGLVEMINRALGTPDLEVISPGISVKAMIINGLGLVSTPLYLFEKFFVGKATTPIRRGNRTGAFK